MIKLPVGNGDDKIINVRVVFYFQRVTAPINQQFHKKPGGSFVSVHKTMIIYHAVKDRRSFAGY